MTVTTPTASNDVAGKTLDAAYAVLKTNTTSAPPASAQYYGAAFAQANAERDLVFHDMAMGRLSAAAILGAAVFLPGGTSGLSIPSTDVSTLKLLSDMAPLGFVTFASSVGGAAAGTLSNAVTPGTYATTFANGQVKSVTVAAGGTAATWTGNLSAGTVVTASMALPGSAFAANSALTSTLVQKLDQLQRELVAVCIAKGYTSPAFILASSL